MKWVLVLPDNLDLGVITMRIAIFVNLSDPTFGGSATFESSLLKAILERGDTSRHSFVLIGNASPLLRDAERSGFQVIILRTGFGRIAMSTYLLGTSVARQATSFRRRFRVVRQFEYEARRAGVDLTWSLGPMVPSFEIPYVITVWDLQHRLQPFFPEVSVRGRWDRRESYYSTALRRAALVIAPNETGKHEIQNFYQVPSERIIVLPHPVPQWAVTASADESRMHALTGDGFPPYVLYPASFMPHKNHIGLVKALAVLRKEGVEIGAVFVGSDRGNLSHVAGLIDKLDLGDRIRVLGFVDQRDLGVLYKGSLALVFPTFFGPENLPPLEAFSLGVPVLASRVDGSEEQLGDSALLFDPTDPSEIASAVRTIVHDEDLRRTLVERGRERIKGRSPGDFVESVLKALDRFQPVRSSWQAGSNT